ncbi:hypothetical protein N320_07303, partial [Buceros rhinoceros silvestris]
VVFICRSWRSWTWITGITSEGPVHGKIPRLFRSNIGRLSISRQND